MRYGHQYLLPQEKTAEAIEQCRLALQADPLFMIFHFGLVWCLFCDGQYGESLACARRALEIDPNFHPVWLALGFAQMGSGLSGEAVVSFTRAVELAPWAYVGPGCLAAACWLSGDHQRASELARQSVGQGGVNGGLNFGHAIYYAAAGEPDAMFEALDGAYQRRDFYLPFLRRVALFDPYRADPRFQSLLKRMNLA